MSIKHIEHQEIESLTLISSSDDPYVTYSNCKISKLNIVNPSVLTLFIGCDIEELRIYHNEKSLVNKFIRGCHISNAIIQFNSPLYTLIDYEGCDWIDDDDIDNMIIDSEFGEYDYDLIYSNFIGQICDCTIDKLTVIDNIPINELNKKGKFCYWLGYNSEIESDFSTSVDYDSYCGAYFYYCKIKELDYQTNKTSSDFDYCKKILDVTKTFQIRKLLGFKSCTFKNYNQLSMWDNWLVGLNNCNFTITDTSNSDKDIIESIKPIIKAYKNYTPNTITIPLLRSVYINGIDSVVETDSNILNFVLTDNSRYIQIIKELTAGNVAVHKHSETSLLDILALNFNIIISDNIQEEICTFGIKLKQALSLCTILDLRDEFIRWFFNLKPRINGEALNAVLGINDVLYKLAMRITKQTKLDLADEYTKIYNTYKDMIDFISTCDEHMSNMRSSRV